MGVIETDSIARKLIHDRSPQGLVGAKGIIDARIAAPIIGKEEKDIGPFRILGGRGCSHAGEHSGHPRYHPCCVFEETSA